MAKTAKSYGELMNELDEVMMKLQDDSIDVDLAITLYERGIQLTQQLTDYLTKSENKLTELKKLTGEG